MFKNAKLVLTVLLSVLFLLYILLIKLDAHILLVQNVYSMTERRLSKLFISPILP